MERIPTREACARTLVELGRENPDVVVFEADIAKSTKTLYFAKEFPDRFFEMGIAEQNMLGAAAGMATTGKLPFVSTYAVFASMRACEQIRTFICYPNLNVKIVASHGGLTPGNDGPTHQAIEDLAIMRSIPNMTVLMPADAVATRSLVRSAAQMHGPVYVRLTRDPVPVIYPEDTVFSIGKAVEFRPGSDVTLIAIGDMVAWAAEAAEELAKEGISARVLDMHTLKPLDKEAVVKAAQETGALVTVEDHNIYGGLGSAVAEVVAEECLVPLKRVGIPDTFAESGEYELLLEKYGLGIKDIKRAAEAALSKKVS
ncbi:transketolase family protein [Gelria sp. Kuro-4]|uniref:transketolase family protein n=1 Tax=Gelria sp. Kuro-4 TaxID=2796927 RepID=UPI001BF03213|nr:transketolase family protein [Gelria sp. Kuro-4]BCV24142.1 transketolase [Gelria sp. Kuro-4]